MLNLKSSTEEKEVYLIYVTYKSGKIYDPILSPVFFNNITFSKEEAILEKQKKEKSIKEDKRKHDDNGLSFPDLKVKILQIKYKDIS